MATRRQATAKRRNRNRDAAIFTVSLAAHIAVLAWFGSHIHDPYRLPTLEEPPAVDVELFTLPPEPPVEPIPDFALREIDPQEIPRETPPPPPAVPPVVMPNPPRPQPVPSPPTPEQRVVIAPTPPAPAPPRPAPPTPAPPRPVPPLPQPAPPSPAPPAPIPAPPTPAPPRPTPAPPAPAPVVSAPAAKPAPPRPRKVDEDAPDATVAPLRMAPVPGPSAPPAGSGAPPAGGSGGAAGRDFTVQRDGLSPGPLPGAEGGLRAALRRSGVGCANQDAVKLTKAERDKCLERAGANQAEATSPLLGINKGKLTAMDREKADKDNYNAYRRMEADYPGLRKSVGKRQ